MKLWRAHVQLNKSGFKSTLSVPTALPRQPSSIKLVAERIRHMDYIQKGKPFKWLASATFTSDQWIEGIIGKANTTADQPQWDEAERAWHQDAARSHVATNFLIHIPSKRLVVQANGRLSRGPDEVVTALQALFNMALTHYWPQSDWVISFPIIRTHHTFEKQFAEIERIRELRVTMMTPNSRSDEALRLIQGLGGQAGAEQLQMVLRSSREIDKGSDFVQGVLQCVRDNVARVILVGTLAGKPNEKIDSLGSAEPVVANFEGVSDTLRAIDGSKLVTVLDEQDDQLEAERRRAGADTGDTGVRQPGEE